VGAGIIGLHVAVVDDRDHQQRQAHLAGADYHGIHGAHDISTGDKFSAANRGSRCKNRIEIVQWLAL
jgi:hypothetical protein